MKISKILAGLSAAAIAASMVAIPASAADTDYLYLVKASWNGNTPTDGVEGTVKWTENVVKGACDLNAWDTGSIKYNGEWAQCILTSDDLSSVSITFTITSNENSTWEAHQYDDEAPAEDQVYQVFLTLGQTETVPYETITQPDDLESNNNKMVATCINEWTYTYGSDVIQSAIDNGKAEFSANEDGTYTLGFNIQVGHVADALVTGTVTADNLYQGASDSTDSTGSSTTDSTSSKNDSSTSSTSSSTSSTSSTSSSTSSTKSGSTSSAAKTTSTAGSTTSAASDNTSNAESGAAAGVGLAIAALAGAAIVVSRKK
jgi:hypothetical protein